MWSTFPCWAWNSDDPIDLKQFVHSFQESQPSDRWVFCGDEVAQTPRQLWTAAVVSSRNIERSTAQARTLDAEFLRVLSGTHNVSEAFKRAGLAQGADQAGYFTSQILTNLKTRLKSIHRLNPCSQNLD